MWDNTLVEREDHQGEMQGGTTSLANTNHTTEQQSDELKAKGQENNGNTETPGVITHAVERDNTSKTREMGALGTPSRLDRLAHGPTLLQLLVFNVQDQGGRREGPRTCSTPTTPQRCTLTSSRARSWETVTRPRR